MFTQYCFRKALADPEVGGKRSRLILNQHLIEIWLKHAKKNYTSSVNTFYKVHAPKVKSWIRHWKG